MLSTRSWIYLDLEKSGCTFLRDALQKIFDPKCFVHTEKHAAMSSLSSLPRVLTIRDPFDYYRSLWSYGLDRRGGFYSYISKAMPELAGQMYERNTPECFSMFLDYVINSPVRYPNKSRYDWLPFSLDLYSTRIISMMIPLDCRQDFLDRLGFDYPDTERLVSACSAFVPEILIRTDRLNPDFHGLADSGRLDFMKLPVGWKQIFPLDSPPKNASILFRDAVLADASLANNLWMPGWRSIVEQKSGISLWLYELASCRINEL